MTLHFHYSMQHITPVILEGRYYVNVHCSFFADVQNCIPNERQTIAKISEFINSGHIKGPFDTDQDFDREEWIRLFPHISEYPHLKIIEQSYYIGELESERDNWFNPDHGLKAVTEDITEKLKEYDERMKQIEEVVKGLGGGK